MCVYINIIDLNPWANEKIGFLLLSKIRTIICKIIFTCSIICKHIYGVILSHLSVWFFVVRKWYAHNVLTLTHSISQSTLSLISTIPLSPNYLNHAMFLNEFTLFSVIVMRTDWHLHLANLRLWWSKIDQSPVKLVRVLTSFSH